MKFFKNKGELTKFQIMAEVAKGKPHVRQKDIANELGVTVQAVSENLKTLTDEGWVETDSRQPRYKITKRGIEMVKKGALDLRKYSDEILNIMTTYKSVWPAIATEELKVGENVWLKMEGGILYAGKEKTSANAEVLRYADKGEDVALVNLGGLIELKPGFVIIIKLPTIYRGGSKGCDLEHVEEVMKKYSGQFHKVGVMGTVSRAMAKKLEIKPDFEFASYPATVSAVKRGLNVLIFTVGKMTRNLTEKLDEEGISYIIEDMADMK